MLITDLPCEVLAVVLRDLDSLEELGQAILACKHFYNTFTLYKDIPGTVLASTLDPELLPLAVATELVRDLPKPRSAHAVRDSVDGFVYNRSNALRELKRMDIARLLHLRRTQEAIVELAFDMAEHAYQQFNFSEYAIAYEEADVGLSPAEATRFCRALYRTQLYLEAFDDDETATVEQGQAWLVLSFAMFEIEQIACVYDYLERLVIIHCRFVLAKDYYFGRRRYNYLSLGQNGSIHHFLNQGVIWLAQLINFDENDPISTLQEELRSVSRKHTASPSLFLALSALRAKFSSDEALVQCRQSPRDNFDSDSGPPSSLDAAHADLYVQSTLEDGRPWYIPNMDPEDYGIREQAYVLWDMSRVKDQDLFYQISIAPEGSSIEPELWEFHRMEDWFSLCTLDWADIERDYPWVFDALTNGWESRLMLTHVAAGEGLAERTFWLPMTAADDEQRRYFNDRA